MCNCNKRRAKRVLRSEQVLADQAERLALAAGAGPQPAGPWPEQPTRFETDETASE